MTRPKFFSTVTRWIQQHLPKKEAAQQPQDDPRNYVYEDGQGGYVNGANEPCDADGHVFSDDQDTPPEHPAQQPKNHPYAGFAVIETAGFHTWLQRNTIKLALAIGVPIIWLIASYGVAQWLSGFHPLTMDFTVVMQYVTSGAYELFGIAFLFVAVRNKSQGKSYWGAIAIALFVVLSSFIGQYLLLYSEAFRSFLFIPPQAFAGLPFDQRAAILFRASIPCVIEFGLIFLIAEKKADIHETIAQQRKVTHEESLLKDEQAQMAQMAMAREAVSVYMNNVTKMLQRQIAAMSSDQQLIEEHIQPHTKIVYVHDELEAPAPPAPQKAQPSVASLGTPTDGLGAKDVQSPPQPQKMPVASPQSPPTPSVGLNGLSDLVFDAPKVLTNGHAESQAVPPPVRKPSPAERFNKRSIQ